MPSEAIKIVLVGLINITPQLKNIKDDNVYSWPRTLYIVNFPLQHLGDYIVL